MKNSPHGVKPLDSSIRPEEVTLAIEGWNASDLDSRQVFEQSLRSLLDQTFPVRRSEVFITVDASADPAESAWIKDLLPESQILELPGSTYYRSKNLAIESAHGEYLVFADSDLIYEPQWLESLLAAFQPGIDLVAGNTQYQPGFLSRTLSLCDWPATRLSPGYTDWLYGNNLAMRRRLFETIRFRDDIGRSGGGGSNVLRAELSRRGIRPWFSFEARGWHYLEPFWIKRLRIGAYQVQYRRIAPEVPWAWLVRVPLVGPLLIIAGTLLKAWKRAWQLRSTLPGRGLSLPFYMVTISGVKAVELLGALMVAWAPAWVNRRYSWFDLPPSSKQSIPLDPS
jgi:glycosyltransferase involved in cell wall biosynthesis